MSEQHIDPKVYDRLSKLLRLARDGGATEGEANNAMEMAQKIALANNLDIATIELEGGSAGEDAARMKDVASGEGKRSWAQYPWQQALMAEIGRVNFCYVEVKWGTKAWKEGRGKFRPIGYTIIGRKSNVVNAKEMFTYLILTINRLLLEHNGGDASQNMSRYSNSWKEGCAERLRERLTERHDRMLAEQAREARERATRSQHPAAAPTGNALVVVMTDFAQDEEDANMDVWAGNPIGTRKAAREREAANQRAREEALRLRLEEAKAAGATDREIAAMRQYDYTLDQARLLIAQIDAPEPEDNRTEAQKRKDQEKEDRDQARWEARWRKQREKERNRLDHRGYHAGRSTGDSIGLDKQVSKGPSKPGGLIK